MIPRKTIRHDNVNSNRPDSIIIPSDSESDFDELKVEETITVTGSDPSRTAAKRKAPGPNPFLRPRKRIQVSQPAHDVPDKATSQKPPHDPRFWYPDGNVVIKVGDIYFKLFRSRLAQQCRYFKWLFSPPAQGQAQPSSSKDSSHTAGAGDDAPLKELDGCTVYEVSGIAVSDFTTFINFLEYPLEYSVSTAPSDKLYALLRASDALGCDLVHGLAKKAVAKQWPSHQPPKKDVHSLWDGGSPTRANDAIQAIAHARKYCIPGVLKGALYELLRNTAFWDAVRHAHTHTYTGSRPKREAGTDRDMLAPLARGDLAHLQQARWELREAWDELVRTPPGCDKGWKGTTCTVCPPAQHGQPQNRTDAWAVELAHADARVKFGDPIMGTYGVEEWLDALKRHSRGKWCEGCLDERKYMWGEARTTWWRQLDGWLQTRTGEWVMAVGLRVEMRKGHASGSGERRLLM